MERYKDFSPTPMDPKGYELMDRQDWFVVPVMRTRDSEALAQSNFKTALEILGGEGEDVEVHRFRHWGPGWFEIILVRPDTNAEMEGIGIEGALEDYPVLDDADLVAWESDAW